MAPILNCYFCGGRVITIEHGRTAVSYECEAEGVRWDITENLTIYTPYDGPPPPVQGRDRKTGRYIPIPVVD